MLAKIEYLIHNINNNKKVIENYLFMTALPILSSLVGILLYPYLIRKLGAENYGLYIFSISFTSYFIGFISFGFSFPALKGIVENRENQLQKNKIVSSVFSAKLLLAIISVIIFILTLMFIPIVRNNKLIFIISFSQIISEIFYPSWYFQGMQKMHVVTVIQLGFRLLTIPFIFIFIKNPVDIWIFALITSLSIILSGAASILFLIFKEKIVINFISFKGLGKYFREALPFFWSSTIGTMKQESVTIFIGAFFGMSDVAIYDLANKIVIIPRMLTMSINSALFPKVISNAEKLIIKKIIKYETIIGFATMFLVILFGYWIVLLMGGINMISAYPIAIILSFTVLSWLVVGGYINFIFIPQNLYYFVTRNQFVAFISFLFFSISGLLFSESIYVLIIALAFSGLVEILYCKYLINKHHLL